MLSYNHCIRLEFLSYEVSPLDSSHCIEYIRKNRLGCNVLDVSSKQLLTISTQHLYTETELEKVEKHIARLWKQKKMWHEKLICTISRDIFDIEKLERMEIEKAVKVRKASRFLGESPFIIIYKLINIKGRYYPNFQKVDKWFLPSDFVLSLGLLIDLKILRNVETFSNI